MDMIGEPSHGPLGIHENPIDQYVGEEHHEHEHEEPQRQTWGEWAWENPGKAVAAGVGALAGASAVATGVANAGTIKRAMESESGRRAAHEAWRRSVTNRGW